VVHSDYSRDLHMDATTLCENVMDPAHLPFTHHKTISRRDKAQPIPFGPVSPLTPAGFEADRPTTGWPGKVTFRAPHLVLAETHRGEGSFSDWNVVYAVPISPGRCRLLVRVVFETARMPPPLKWIIAWSFTRQPTWFTHLGSHVILEDDNPFLHTQGHTYRNGHPSQLAPEWRRRLYMPSTSDTMVIAFRRWLDQFTNGEGPRWSEHLPRDRTGPWRRSTREQVLERAESHVSHCSACSGALANALLGRRVAKTVFVGALALAGLVARLRSPACLVAALAFAAEALCASLVHRLAVGKYPPPRNVGSRVASVSEIGGS
jgi:hypothetical protein